MVLVDAKLKILENLWKGQKPVRAREIAQKVNLGIGATTMHLLGLKKWGYVYTPEHGYYAITNLGKETIGLPKIDKAQAAKILSNLPNSRAFLFYKNINHFTNVQANSLTDFCERIQKIDVKSVEFHVPRKDFESWVQILGDLELAKRFGLIRDLHLSGEKLRTKVYETVKYRLEELKFIQG
jgi:hypothetical protein